MTAATATYELVPITLAGAKAFVNFHHRHNEAPIGWKFGVGLARDEHLIGVAMAGRPTGRMLDQERDVEITRCCIDEAGIHKNAASRLYGAVCRMAAAGGYRNAYTYTIEGEDAASVKAAGFVLDAELPARESWSTPGRLRQDETLFGPRLRPRGGKFRWKRVLAVSTP